MSMTISLDSAMTRDIETLAAKNGVTAVEYVTNILAEAIEDSSDYDRCVEIIEKHEKNPESYSHKDVMKEFGLR